MSSQKFVSHKKHSPAMIQKKSFRPEVRQLSSIVSLKFPDEFADGEIAKLKYYVSNIFYDREVSVSYQDLYNKVENLCTLNKLDEVYGDLTVVVSEYLQLRLVDLVYYDGEHFLRKLKDFWLGYSRTSRLVKNVYLCLETHSSRLGRRTGVWQSCLAMFHSIVMTNPTVKEKLGHVFALIEDERNGSAVNSVLINEIVSMLTSLELYESYFEREFLARSKRYYREKRDEWMDGDVVAYFYKIQQKLGEEENRAKTYLKGETDSVVLGILYKVLIKEKLDILIAKLEEADVFEKCELYELMVLYDLLLLVPKASQDLCRIFGTYIVRKGSEIVFDATKNESGLIGGLLDFKDRVDEIVAVCFEKDSSFVESVRVCFKKFINERKYKPAQFLAKYIDGKMCDKCIPEDLLDKIMVLFRYIQGKDVFEVYYKRYLSKRLLLGKSSSQDAEKYMISKLKLECGDGFTSKLEGMFKDIELSETLTSSFKQKHSAENLPIEFSANVLTSSCWPSYTKYEVSMPESLLRYQTIFHEFYKAKYSGRSLQWIPGLGSCLLKAELSNGRKEFQVSLFQALVILLFNEADRLTYKTVQLHLNLESGELYRTLLSLTCGKVKLLVKEPPGSELKDDDSFSVNSNFTNKLFRIKINQLQYKDTDEEQKLTEEEVLHDRHLQIDAALVRLMKQNKRMRHGELVARMYDVLKFPVNSNDVKKRIEILIERDFLARNPDDTNAYYYVA